jgi:hypothetical protein
MRYLFGFMCVLALGVTGCGETAGGVGGGGTGGVGGDGGAAGGVGGTGGTAGQCDDGTQAAYDSATCQACVACASEGPCPCNAQSCQDFLGCALSCTTVACSESCIDRYPAGAHLFLRASQCAVCDTCPNNCGFPANPDLCDSGLMTCFQGDECTGSLICCQDDPFTLGLCVTQAACDELLGV